MFADLIDILFDALLVALAGALCATAVMVPVVASVPSHNASGGYIDACGDLPGMVGDDC